MIEVIGAGYGRTGTKSLQLALEKLGLGKCYHMEELLRNPEGVTHWKDAYNEQKVNWNDLFQNYSAIVDFPGAMYYKEMASYYPDAKVVLSVRDPEAWYESTRKTIYSFDPGPGLKMKMLFKMPFSKTARNLFQVIMLNDKSIWKKHFEGQFDDKEYAIQNYRNHVEEVQRTIPADRLLIFDCREGWEPLCSFLDKEVPAEPYPSTNRKEDFHTWAKGIVNEVL